MDCCGSQRPEEDSQGLLDPENSDESGRHETFETSNGRWSHWVCEWAIHLGNIFGCFVTMGCAGCLVFIYCVAGNPSRASPATTLMRIIRLSCQVRYSTQARYRMS